MSFGGTCIIRIDNSSISIGEYSYAYMEQQDEDTYVPRIGKRAGKKDIIKAEIKLIEYPGT